MATEQQARLSIVQFNLSYNGWGDGGGYPGRCPNPATTYLGRPCEYSCADGYTFACKHQGYRLPVMQRGLATGFAYCPSGMDYARAHGASRPSWQAEPADAVFINTGNGAQPGHVEMVEKRVGNLLYTFGWDSGPSNVDNFRGQGGCHRHVWSTPPGVGSPAIMTTMDLSKVVNLGSTPAPTPKPAPPHPNPGHPLLMLKTPLMGTPKGWPVVAQVQNALNHHGASPRLLADGIFGPKTEQEVWDFQGRARLHQDGIVGPQTYSALGIQ